jgi:hypothetical protein
MINKQNLWFVTLFSLILILGIYYVSIDDEVETVLKTEEKELETIEINESDVLVALEVSKEEEQEALMEEYQNTLLNEKSTIEEKNTAYENMQNLNTSKAEEARIKNKIKKNFNYNSYVKLDKDQISIVISSKEHNMELANKIIRSIQEDFDEDKYITVKFNS